MDDCYCLLDAFPYFIDTPQKIEQDCSSPQERCLLMIVVVIYQVLTLLVARYWTKPRNTRLEQVLLFSFA